MLDIPVYIKETKGLTRNNESISFGIPFKEGLIYNPHELSLFDQDKELLNNIITTAYWPDKSIKWAFVNSQVCIQKNSKSTLQLKRINKRSTRAVGVNIKEENHAYIISTGRDEFTLYKDSLIPLPTNYVISDEKNKKRAEIILKTQKNDTFKIKVSSTSVENEGLNSTVLFKGTFVNENIEDEKLPLIFESRITFYANKSLVKWQFTIANPNAAQHSGGKWDLGDLGSHYFTDLSIELPLNSSAEVNYKLQWNEKLSQVIEGKLSIFQCSSGGENWFSNNHVNKCGEMPLNFKGYQVCNGHEKVSCGERASPYVFVNDNDIHLGINIANFWQNFPKAITIEQNKLRLSLFPHESDDAFELQAGEQKTHHIHFDFSTTHEDLIGVTNPLELSFSPLYLSETNAIHWLCGNVDDNALIKLIIDNGLNGKNNFFNKREIIDEFGWRNFGEVYADHESLGHEGETPLISHYNNQYDPILGFARMYLQTGEQRWFELMNDLAQHVVDIDIYNTDSDRHEYNRGLFWHTDHYLDAETCTHRTFSKHHKAVYQDHTGGGGPGSEHCYTAGLVSHYYITGEKQSKSTVLNLANWFIAFQEGNGSFLARLLEVKQKDIKLIKRLLKGEEILKTKYPLTRGTSNYMCTLMDAYALTGDKQYLKRVEGIIVQTINPNEKISLRNLHNKELTWSYLIVLQGLTKYLALKANLEEFDESFIYARDALLLYTDWMLENEEPYLDKPELLEFPNKTWIAQDLRKANILFIASQYTTQSDLYISKAKEFIDYVVNNLKKDKEAEFSRILILLMQNQGPEGCFSQYDMNLKRGKIVVDNTLAPKHSIASITKGILVDLSLALINFSFKKEKRWLKYRMQ